MKPPIDWAGVIQDCQTGRGDYRAFEKATGIDAGGRNNYLYHESSPRHHRGEIILDYWSAHTGKPVSCAPRLAK